MRSRADLQPLLDGHWYDAVAACLDLEVGNGVADSRLAEAHRLAVAARRVLDLDAEDFDGIAQGFPDRPWAAELANSCFPVEPRSANRGALGSLVPLYRLMLEVLDVRAVRREPLQVVVTAHLIGEYLVQLAWESTLGHAGDPLRMARDVGERWGTDDPQCPHSSQMRAAAHRSLHACEGDQAGYTAYLDRFHSRLGSALASCALNHPTVAVGVRPDVAVGCPNPCQWALRGSVSDRRDLDARVRLALLYQGSAIVSLRHHAPVGHFFGVPSTSEISDAWLRTWQRLTTQWPDGANPLRIDSDPVAEAEPLEALPGMSALVSAVAGRRIGPGRVIRSIGGDLARALPQE